MAGGGGARTGKPGRAPGLLLGWSLLLLYCWECTAGGQDDSRAEAWLRLYGYLPPVNRQMSTLRSAQIFSSAISEMQQFYGIPVTGELDQTTREWMQKPRCGVPDQFGSKAKSSIRLRRYAHTGRKWNKLQLTYSIQNHSDRLGVYNSLDAIRKAFTVWSSVTPLTFSEIPYESIRQRQANTDILILFASGFHGDSSPFDGPGGFLAHAYFPGPGMGGDAHFDLEEPWTVDNSDVAGSPSNEAPSTLSPFTTPGRPDRRPPKSPPGGKPDRPGNAPPRGPSSPDRYGPNICEGNFDAVTILRGEMFVFKGAWFWRVRNNRVLDNYPMPIGHFWRGLPPNISAVYERHDSKFVFFKGDKYWVFHEANLEPGYPQPLTNFGYGIPYDRIDTAIWWEPTGYTYLFRGDSYWRFNEETRSVDTGYPKSIKVWAGIPDTPKGAFLISDTSFSYSYKEAKYTYFYKGAKYWKFDNQRLKTEPGYPKSILRDFMGCQEEVVKEPDAVPRWPDVERPPFNPDIEPEEQDRDKETAGREDNGRDVDVVVHIDEYTRAVSVAMVIVPLLLLLCILGLIYIIVQMHRKGPPKSLRYCKRSLQEWV
ncbi:matrix metalloproteinase-15 isoform X2 [Dendropsophus ebraccatus]|uniref:matrix metalloproteinase-15 isoform X2 n=1 Tax=Dendropsophus ebraccatus TaxID=150705 RepID=UPI003831E2E8